MKWLRTSWSGDGGYWSPKWSKMACVRQHGMIRCTNPWDFGGSNNFEDTDTTILLQELEPRFGVPSFGQEHPARKVMLVKQCHKPIMTGNGLYQLFIVIWGMVDYCLPTFIHFAIDYHARQECIGYNYRPAWMLTSSFLLYHVSVVGPPILSFVAKQSRCHTQKHTHTHMTVVWSSTWKQCIFPSHDEQSKNETCNGPTTEHNHQQQQQQQPRPQSPRPTSSLYPKLVTWRWIIYVKLPNQKCMYTFHYIFLTVYIYIFIWTYIYIYTYICVYI